MMLPKDVVSFPAVMEVQGKPDSVKMMAVQLPLHTCPKSKNYGDKISQFKLVSSTDENLF